MYIFQIWVVQSLTYCFLSFVLLSNNTSHAQSEDYLSNTDFGVAAIQPPDETDPGSSFLNDSPSLEVPASDLFTTADLDDSLFSIPPVSDISASGDEPNFDLLASTVDDCSLDSNPGVKKRQSCLSETDGLTHSAQNIQPQPGALTPKIIENLIKKVPYGLELSLESDYAWCDPIQKRKYAICDSGFSYDRIPLFASLSFGVSDVYDLYDCSPCAFFSLFPFPLPPSFPLLSSRIFSLMSIN